MLTIDEPTAPVPAQDERQEGGLLETMLSSQRTDGIDPSIQDTISIVQDGELPDWASEDDRHRLVHELQQHQNEVEAYAYA